MPNWFDILHFPRQVPEFLSLRSVIDLKKLLIVFLDHVKHEKITNLKNSDNWQTFWVFWSLPCTDLSCKVPSAEMHYHFHYKPDIGHWHLMIYDFKVQQQASALLLAALNKSVQSTAWVIIDCVVNPGHKTQPWSYWTFFTVSSWEGSIDYQVYTDYPSCRLH